MAIHLLVVHVNTNSCLCWKNMSKSLKNVSLYMWFDGENESLNVKFM